ncbi:MAG: hypothetical protein NTZ05_00915 [Chloroflexi bacterium]|nr:hypothetical protein [Chloroflexota bacterium]
MRLYHTAFQTVKQDGSMYDGFWQFYREYDDKYQRDGDPGLQTMESDGATFEIRISMGIPRAKMRLPRQIEPRGAAAEAAVRLFADRNGFALDFRDDSWVLTGEENLYYGRIRVNEVWFTPEKFDDRRVLLDEMTGIYQAHGAPAEAP